MAPLRLRMMIAAITLIISSAIATPRGQADSIGINYGRVANNLPPPSEVVRLLQSRSIRHARIYDTDPTVLTAFANSGIDLGVTIPNADVAALAHSTAAADQWVLINIVSYGNTNFASIAVGNEFLADASLDHSTLLPAMMNLQQSLLNRGIGSVKVSTPFSMGGLLAPPGFPPSSGTFSSDVAETLRSMLAFLSQHNSVFMINVYPFFSYRDNPVHIALDYALLNPTAIPVTDAGSNLRYRNLFDAMVDTVISAMTKLGYGGLPLVVTESGWASGPDPGEFAATVRNAQSYNGNLVKHVLGSEGTPLRPGSGRIPAYLFAVFNENLKGGSAVEQHFGLYYPNQTAVYNIQLTALRSVDMNGSVLELGSAGVATALPL